MNSKRTRVRRPGITIVFLINIVVFLGCCPIIATAESFGNRLAEEITETSYYSAKTIYDYDRTGQLAQKTVLQNGKVESTTEYHYSSDGTLCEELYKGIINLYFHYDSKGTVIERDETGGVGSPACWNPYAGDIVRTEYDSNGRIICLQIISGETGKANTLTYEYDNQGRILCFRVGDYRTDSYDYRPDGSYIRMRDDKNMNLFITEYYNTEGLRTQVDRRQFSDISTVYYAYDECGHLISQSDSQYNSQRGWKYDDHGNLLEEWVNGNLQCSYLNDYDAYGNLTHSVRVSGDTTLTTIYRYE